MVTDNAASAGNDVQVTLPTFSLDGFKDTGGNLGISLNYSVGIAYNPAKKDINFNERRFDNSGAVLANVFLDENQNGIFDNKDTPLKDIELTSPVSTNQTTGDNGKLFITNIPPYQKYEISVKEEKFNGDNVTLSAPDKIGFIARPGSVVNVDIPVYETAYIEGEVNIKTAKNDTLLPKKGIKLRLINNKGKVVQETLSDFDGIFTFNKIPLGKYRIFLDKKQLEKLGYNYDKEKLRKTIELESKTFVYSYGDVELSEGNLQSQK